MSRKWIPVSPPQAKAHPLYGREGWLAVFAVALAIGLIISGAFWAGMTMVGMPTGPLTQFLKVSMAVTAFATAIPLALFIARSRRFRAATISLIVAPWPVLAAIYRDSLPPDFILAGSVAWLISVIVGVAYLQRSKRVRVTFEHRVLDEPWRLRTEPTSAWPHAAFSDPQAARIAEGAESFSGQNFGAIDTHQPDVGVSGSDPAEECWAQALAEYESNRRKPGLWARAYAEAQGDEAVAKAHYLKHRASQLFDAYQEQAREIAERQQAAQEAAERARRYEESLTDHQLKMKRAIEQAESHDDGSLDAMINLIRLLGGTVERKSSIFFSRWIVEIAGYRNQFANDDELKNWAMSVVVPRAKLLLPPMDRAQGSG